MNNNNNNTNNNNNEQSDSEEEEEVGVQLDASQLSRLQRYFLYLQQRFLQGMVGDDSDSSEEESSEIEEEEDERRDEQRQNLLHTDLHNELYSRNGCNPAKKQNETIYSLLKNRELGMSNSKKRKQSMRCSPGFGERARNHITQRFVPNQPETIAQHEDHVFCGLFSKDGSLYMSACQDRHIRLYNTRTWKKEKEIIARDVGWSIISTDYSPNKDWLIYSSWSDFVHLCNTRGEHEVHEALEFKPESHRFCLFSIQFSRDSSEILGGSSDKHLYIYDIVRNERILRIEGHVDDINAVAFADRSSQIFFSGSDDTLVKVWDRRAIGCGCVGVLPGHSEGITFIDTKDDGTYLISNGKDQTIKLWDLRKMKNASDVKAPSGCSFDYRDTWGLSRRQRSMNSNTRRGNPLDCSIMTYRGHKVFQTLIRCRFSPAFSTGQKYIYAGSFDGSIYIYDVLTGDLICKPLNAHRGTIRDLSWHPYEPTLVSSSWDGSVKKWNYDPCCDPCYDGRSVKRQKREED